MFRGTKMKIKIERQFNLCGDEFLECEEIERDIYKSNNGDLIIKSDYDFIVIPKLLL